MAGPNDSPRNPLATAGGALATLSACLDQDTRHARMEHP